MTEPTLLTNSLILGIAGALILGLFSLLWFFVQKFIKKTEDTDNDLIFTLEKLNGTMNELNTNLVVFRTTANEEFKVLHEGIEDIKIITAGHSGEIDKLKTKVNIIETHHSRNHPSDKIS
jgi:hypothetical protein